MDFRDVPTQEGHSMPIAATGKPPFPRPRKERVLVEFPASLLKRADEVARELGRNRSELIRAAVEQFVEEMSAKRFEQELAAGYSANAQMNLGLAEEFTDVDREGF
jgi:metal-responsive CopG/Arc/MetJ family transcriptional regulator